MEEKFRQMFLSEFVYHDGEREITMNLVQVCTIKNEITVNVTDEGKHSMRAFDLKLDGEKLYFEFGRQLDEIAIDDFVNPDEE